MPLIEIDGEVDIFGDGRLVLFPLPGLLAALPTSGAHLLASDAVALRENVQPENMPEIIWNRDLQTKSIAEIKRVKIGDATSVRP